MNRPGLVSEAVAVYHVETGNWLANDLIPSLNTGRFNHSSTTVGTTVAIVCGADQNECRLKNIELLKIRVGEDGSIQFVSKKWDQFEIELVGRIMPLCIAISKNKMIIYGGASSMAIALADGIIVNIDT